MRGAHDDPDHRPARLGARRRGAALAGAALLALAAPVAAVAASPVVLPSTRLGLSASPPLLVEARLLEQRFPGPIASRERVLVRVAPDGEVRSVRVVQRLTLSGLGDYVFAVGAPVVDVRPVAGSRSEPGLRRDAIYWQGFSPGRRELAADAGLRVADAAPFLPLRVSRKAGGLVLENVTGVAATGFGGDAPAGELAAAARAIRRAAASGGVADGLVVNAARVAPRQLRVEAPLEVEGQVGGRRFAAVLGGGRPFRLVVPAGPDPAAGFLVVARPLLPDDTLAGTPTLARTVEAVLRLARVRQYDSFLANPDPHGSVQAVYEYRPARAAPSPTRAAEPGGGGRGALGLAALLGTALVGLGGLAALWARS